MNLSSGIRMCPHTTCPCAGIPVGQASIGLLIFIAFFLVAAVFTGGNSGNLRKRNLLLL